MPIGRAKSEVWRECRDSRLVSGDCPHSRERERCHPVLIGVRDLMQPQKCGVPCVEGLMTLDHHSRLFAEELKALGASELVGVRVEQKANPPLIADRVGLVVIKGELPGGDIERGSQVVCYVS